MPGDSEFFPPVQYLPWWGIIGFVLLLAVVGWYVFLFVSTRAGRVPSSLSTQPETSRTIESVRTEYLELIDRTRQQYARGVMDSREAHHQLSQIVRSFVSEREGRQTMQMTLTDLRATSFTPLTAAVEKLYPGAFGVDSGASVDRVVDEAKRLVSRWQ